MRTFDELVPEAFTLVDGRYVFAFGHDPLEHRHFTLELEPMIPGGYLVAVYEHRAHWHYPQLILPGKLPMKPIIRGSRPDPLHHEAVEAWAGAALAALLSPHLTPRHDAPPDEPVPP